LKIRRSAIVEIDPRGAADVATDGETGFVGLDAVSGVDRLPIPLFPTKIAIKVTRPMIIKTAAA